MPWSLNPTWFDPAGPVPVLAVPELNINEQSRWERSLKLTYVKAVGQQCLTISEVSSGVSLQSIMAATRYRLLEPLEEHRPHWALLLIMLAEAHYLLNDTYGSHVRLSRAVELVGGVGVDTVLDEAVRQLATLVEESAKEDQDEASEGVVVKDYRRPTVCVASTVDVEAVRDQWQEVQNARTEAVAIEQFARYAALTTNVLEGVFELEGRSWSKLVDRGFAINAIEGISMSSRVQKSQKIVDILSNTVECFKFLAEAIRNSNRYDEKLVKRVHSLMLKGDNISMELVDDEEYYSVVPRGQYRTIPCYTSHLSRGYETRFCAAKKIDEEMAWYFEEARRLLDRPDELSPFLAAAWLQYAFLRIHPFADGNGRVSRMISSIPLLVAGLPPVVVVVDRKERYFLALDDADTTGNVHALAAFLQQEAGRAIQAINNLPVEGALRVEIPSPVSANTDQSTPSPLRRAIDAAKARCRSA